MPIVAKQKPYKTPVGVSADSGPFAIFQQLWQPILLNVWLSPWVVFGAGNITKCYGWCNSGTFTADVYLDGVKVFTVTNADTATPVDLLGAETGLLAEPSIVTCQITAVTGTVEGLYIEAKNS
jgi:hypothetical protein